MCRVESLGKAYGGRTLFSDLSFEIGRGHRIAVIGANGSGKTTLLRALTGEEPADAGTVAWATTGELATEAGPSPAVFVARTTKV